MSGLVTDRYKAGLPRGWIEVTLGEVTTIVSGSTPKTGVSDYWGGDVAWITPDDLSKNRAKTIAAGARSLTQAGYDSCSASLMPVGSVLYSSRAPIGYAAIAKAPVCTNQGFKSFVPSDALTSDYLYWFLGHATPSIRKLGSGTTFPELSKKAASGIAIPLPPLNEQRRIVSAIEEQLSRLDAADASLAAAARRIEALRRPIRSLAVAAGLDQSVGDLLDGIEAGKSFKCHGRRAEEHEWGVIKVSAMTWGSFDETENKAVLSDEHVDERWEIGPGDLLLSRANTTEYVGATVLVDGCRSRLLLSDKSMRFLVKPGIDKRWLLHALSSPAARQQMSDVATGTSDSMRNISQEKVKAVRLRVPPLEEQRRIVAEVEARLSEIDALQNAILSAQRRSRALRAAILGRAFRGELVPQDPSDEPAEHLLARLRATRAAEPARQHRSRARG